MPFPESQRPQCAHKACKDIDRYPLDVLGRKFRLIFEGSSEDALSIWAYVNDWKDDEKIPPLKINLLDRASFETNVCTSVHRELEEIVLLAYRPAPI